MAITCTNKPDRVTSDVKGDGFLSTIDLSTRQSFDGLSDDYLQKTGPFLQSTSLISAIDEYGREETALALATVYTELLSKSRIDAYNRLVIERNITDPAVGFNALSSIPTTTVPAPVPDLVIFSSPYRDSFFQNALPGVYDRLQIGPLTPIEFAEFARESNFENMDSVIQSSRKDPFSFLNLLNAALAATALFGALGSVCDILSNPFRGLTGLIESSLDKLKKIQQLKDALLSIQNGIGGLISNALNALASLRDKAFSKIDGFMKSIGKSIQSIVDSVKAKFTNLQDKFNAFSKRIAGAMQGNVFKQIAQSIQNKMNQIRNALSPNNIANMISNATNSMGRFAGQFINMTGEIADYILYNGCKMIGVINDILNSPLNAAKDLLTKSQNEIDALTLASNQNLQMSVSAGRPHAPADEVARVTNDFRQQRRSSALNSVSQSGGYVPPTMHVDVTLNLTTHPEPDAWRHLTFGAQVLNPVQGGQKFWDASYSVNMVDYGGGSIVPKDSGIDNAIGYYGISLEALERAEALGAALVEIGANEFEGAPDSMRSQGKILITSGFRHPIYNQYLRNTGVGAAVNSLHMQGKALDCVQGRGRYRGAFVSLAKAHGFKGIGFYNTFVHIDLGSERTWGDSSGSSYVPDYTPKVNTPPLVAPEEPATVPETPQPQNVRDTARVDNGIPLEPGETLVGYVGDPVTGEPIEKIVSVEGVDSDGFAYTETKTVKL